MRDIRCTRCNKLLLKGEGYFEVKCGRCKFMNVVIDMVRGNSVPLSALTGDSSASTI